MKKLLCLLTIGAMISAPATAVISCNSASTPVPPPDTSHTLADMTFTKSTAVMNVDLYLDIITQIGAKKNPIISNAQLFIEIKNQTLIITIKQGETIILPNTEPTVQGDYTITLEVTATNPYFDALLATDFPISVSSPGKIDLSTFTFNTVHAKTGDELFYDMYDQITKYTKINYLSFFNDIKSRTIKIKFLDAAGVKITRFHKIYPNIVAAGNGIATITITDANPHFMQLTNQTYSVYVTI